MIQERGKREHKRADCVNGETRRKLHTPFLKTKPSLSKERVMGTGDRIETLEIIAAIRVCILACNTGDASCVHIVLITVVVVAVVSCI